MSALTFMNHLSQRIETLDKCIEETKELPWITRKGFVAERTIIEKVQAEAIKHLGDILAEELAKDHPELTHLLKGE